MGNCLTTTEKKTAKCLTELSNVDLLLREMIMKYQNDVDKCEAAIRNQSTTRSTKMYLVRRRKILLKHIDSLHQKLVSVTSKIFSVEQLCLIKKEIESLRTTAKVFKQFAPVGRIEDLTENMEAQLNKVLDIQDLLSSTTNNLDVEEDLALLEKEVEFDTLELPEVPIDVVVGNLDDIEGAYNEDTMLMQAV